MKLKLILSATLFLLLAAPQPARSQELENGYFLGGNPYAFRLNPAFQSERNIVSIALGGTGLGFKSNLGVSTLFYPDANGRLYTFMNERVQAADFMKKIGQRNYLDLDSRVNLLTVGFWSWSRFFTIDFNVRSLNSVSLPYDLFSFLKGGTETRQSFDMSGMGVRSKEFVEAAFGWSNNYDDVFNLGVRVKALVGIGEAEIQARNLRMNLTGERWEIQAQSVLNASSPSLTYSRNGDELDLESIRFNEGTYGPAGYGMALDLGASWNVHPCVTLSASLLDLGTIRWNREIQGVSPAASYTWNPSEQDYADSWQEEMGDAFEEMTDLFRFQDKSGSGAAFEMMPFRVLLGAEFRMPFYDRLSVGALYQGRGGACFAHHSGRISLNWNPLDFLSLSTGTTVDKIGESIGFVLNLHPAGINLMLGCDYLPFHSVDVSPLLDDETRRNLPPFVSRLTLLPRDRMNLNLYVGLNLAFGSRRLDHAKRFM